MVKHGGPCQGPGQTDGTICGVTEIGDKSSWRVGGRFKLEHKGKPCCTKTKCRKFLGVIEDVAPSAAAATVAPASVPEPAGGAAAAAPITEAARSARAAAAAVAGAVGSAATATLISAAAAIAGSSNAPAAAAGPVPVVPGYFEAPAQCYCGGASKGRCRCDGEPAREAGEWVLDECYEIVGQCPCDPTKIGEIPAEVWSSNLILTLTLPYPN